jgi:Zn-dependent M28 family amino/carboxypeptidase
MDGRLTGSEGGRKARAWVVDRFTAIGLQPLGAGGSFEQPFDTPVRGYADGAPQKAANVIGRCAGRTPGGPAIVVSAHYDHVGVRDGQIHWGADDNASGVAVLVGLAARCMAAPFQHDVIFAAFDAEEQGLRGAKAFLAAPPIAPERLAFNLNMDMVSRSDSREIFVAGTHYKPELRTVMQPAAGRSAVRVRFGHDVPGTGHDDWTPQSDHGEFHEAGIPFLYFGVEDHADYHKPTDTAEKIDGTFVEGVAAMILDALTGIDASLPRR